MTLVRNVNPELKQGTIQNSVYLISSIPSPMESWQELKQGLRRKKELNNEFKDRKINIVTETITKMKLKRTKEWRYLEVYNDATSYTTKLTFSKGYKLIGQLSSIL